MTAIAKLEKYLYAVYLFGTKDTVLGQAIMFKE